MRVSWADNYAGYPKRYRDSAVEEVGDRFCLLLCYEQLDIETKPLLKRDLSK